MKRREFLHAGLYGLGIGATGVLPVPPLFARAAQGLGAQSGNDGRILVVLEMSGGNDGLNTVVPYADDAYYKHRPKIGIRANRVRKLDDHFGLSSCHCAMDVGSDEFRTRRRPDRLRTRALSSCRSSGSRRITGEHEVAIFDRLVARKAGFVLRLISSFAVRKSRQLLFGRGGQSDGLGHVDESAINKTDLLELVMSFVTDQTAWKP